MPPRGLWIAFHASALALLTLLLLRFLPVPIALMVVVSSSMEPSILPGDLVLIAGRSFGVGDVIAWCSSPLYCVIHRVVNLSDGYVITKGDANPIPDHPVPLWAVKGRVIAVIPRWLWIPLSISPLAFYIALRWRRIYGELIQISPGSLSPAYALFISYLILSLALLTLSPAMLSIEATPPETPRIWLSKAFLEDSSVYIAYYPEGLEVRGGFSCEILDPLRIPCAPIVINSTVIRIPVDPEILWLSASNGTPLRVRVSLNLTRMASLDGVYSIPIPYEPISIKTINGSAYIENPNPYPVIISYKILYADRPGEPWRESPGIIRIPPRSSDRIGPVDHAYAMLDYSYRIHGRDAYGRIILRSGQ